MIYLIFYDITENSTRSKIAKTLIKEGYERIQYSVFTGLSSPKSKTKLWKGITHLINDETDKIFVLKISLEHFKNMEIIGNLPFEIEYLTGEKRSLTI